MKVNNGRVEEGRFCSDSSGFKPLPEHKSGDLNNRGGKRFLRISSANGF